MIGYKPENIFVFRSFPNLPHDVRPYPTGREKTHLECDLECSDEPTHPCVSFLVRYEQIPHQTIEGCGVGKRKFKAVDVQEHT